MKLLVLGSSDTGGSNLPDPSQAWPITVGRELGKRLGEPVDVTDVLIVPVGKKAVPRAIEAIEKHQPDIVVFSFGGYHFIVASVRNRVNRRFGARLSRFYRRAENRFESATGKPGKDPSGLNHVGRRLARKLIGAEPLTTRDEVQAIQLEIMRQLAQHESIITAILFAPPLGAAIERYNKGANAKLDEYRQFMTAAARDHRFLIADCLPGFAAAEAAGGLRHHDGVHKSAQGHAIQSRAILDALLSQPSPLAGQALQAASAAH